MTDFATALMKLWPNGDQKVPGLRAGIIATAPAVFAKYGITSPLLISHVMAQISHECGAGHDVVENLNYTASRMTQVWPGRFPTIAAAAPYAHDERALGNKTYNGRMGNRPGTDDGFIFRGRGGSQCTGRDGYTRLAKATGLDLLNHPELVNDPKNFLLCSVADFIACGCMPYAKSDDVVGVSSMLNVGHLTDASQVVGMSERRAWLARWKALAPTVRAPAIILSSVPNPLPPDVPKLPPLAGGPKPTIMPPPPSITNPAKGSIGAWVASIFNAIFKRKP